jgi:hypothetical protein
VPDNTLFPSILPDGEFVDDSYSRTELEQKERRELQKIAAEFSGDVNGRMSNEDIIDALEGEPRV